MRLSKHVEVHQAGDHPTDAQEEPDERGNPEHGEDGATGSWSCDTQPVRVIALVRQIDSPHGRIWFGKMLSPPRPEKIELVSDGTSKIPTENTPTTTNA